MKKSIREVVLRCFSTRKQLTLGWSSLDNLSVLWRSDQLQPHFIPWIHEAANRRFQPSASGSPHLVIHCGNCDFLEVPYYKKKGPNYVEILPTDHVTLRCWQSPLQINKFGWDRPPEFSIDNQNNHIRKHRCAQGGWGAWCPMSLNSAEEPPNKDKFAMVKWNHVISELTTLCILCWQTAPFIGGCQKLRCQRRVPCPKFWWSRGNGWEPLSVLVLWITIVFFIDSILFVKIQYITVSICIHRHFSL